jgi:hypothetical protein
VKYTLPALSLVTFPIPAPSTAFTASPPSLGAVVPATVRMLYLGAWAGSKIAAAIPVAIRRDTVVFIESILTLE